MRKVLCIVCISSFIFADGMMSGWNNNDEEAEAKAQKAEQARLCTVYTKKIEKYKETMRKTFLISIPLNYETYQI